MEVRIRRSLFILAIVGAFLLGAIVMGSVILISGGDKPSGVQSDSKFETLKSYIDQYYLNEYDENELMEYAYKGYVTGLGDPYSAYMTQEEYDSFMASATGSYSGIGVTFEEDDKGQFIIIDVTKDSPAEKAGLKSRDQILTVDGKTYDDIEIIAAKIRGKAGTTVKLEYMRGEDIKTVEIVRQKIEQESVEYKMLNGDTGYIEISSFIDNTSEDFAKALKAVQKKGASNLIIDLRDNGGGLVDESVNVADEFLDEGVVCYVEDKNGNSDTYKAKDGKTDLNTVVLINENSASSSEILAAALKDNGYKIIGSKSFGKGIIQSTMELDDGSALKLTVMEYLSPDKHKIHEKGVKPDVKIKDKESTDADEQLDKALEELNE
ncbi:MAG: S41 family peptidase [Bacillota bacterium]|nr:S41 family peptidase [Bacillota bacterium]